MVAVTPPAAATRISPLVVEPACRLMVVALEPSIRIEPAPPMTPPDWLVMVTVPVLVAFWMP